MSRRVLIVEDEANIVESLSFILKRNNCEIAVAGDGEEATRLLEDEAVDVVVLDIMLPRKNGFELLKWIRSEARLATLPVLVLSAKGQERDRQTAKGFGANAFITKPFSNREVVACVDELLNQSQEQS